MIHFSQIKRYKLITLALITFLVIGSFLQKKTIQQAEFNWRFTHPTIIVNSELNNTIEGNYFIISKVNPKEKYIEIENLPLELYSIIDSINWIVGWGKKQRYYNRGNEELAEITGFDKKNNRIYLSKTINFPTKNQRAVFWRKKIPHLIPLKDEPIINREDIIGYPSNSMSFSRIIYDPQFKRYFAFIQPVDQPNTPIFLIESKDLRTWGNTLTDKPIFTSVDFSEFNWSNNDSLCNIGSCPRIGDVIISGEKVYLFMYGFNKANKRQISLAVSETGIKGPYIINSNPILAHGEKGSWNETGVFYPKFLDCGNNNYRIFFDGINNKGEEAVGVAHSTDMINWSIEANSPIISQHEGWRSAKNVSEPAYSEKRGDSIFLLVAGAKAFNDSWANNYIFKDSYMSAKGNVDQTQLGVFLSLDKGKSFIEHTNNPVFINNYLNKYENAHLGANFSIIEKEDTVFYFYQAKTSTPQLRYVVKAYYQLKQARK